MGFGSLGISELLVIFVIVLVFFGPRRMPEIARSLGSAMREFRRSLNQIQREFEEADPRRPPRSDRSVLDRLPEDVRPREAVARPAPPLPADPAPSPEPGPAADADPAPGAPATAPVPEPPPEPLPDPPPAGDRESG